ncbi:hypothetical protein IHN63_03300 [Deinococcus sp. 6YEL10]|uniref:hypothetical protein n=1 Tax=Deinococcus sp. 6YEL10 TaxID=2745870 RepID=UPI001E2D0317|nr:hypothetical protein [Deinococcus sp. 6YEL10]MCD0160327.1 hypothetical protein [Deinococcus sp. 6YEL10]
MTTIQPRTAADTAARPALLTRRIVRYALAFLALVPLAACTFLLDQLRLTLNLLAAMMPLLLLAVMLLLAAFALRPTRDHSDLIDSGPLELF